MTDEWSGVRLETASAREPFDVETGMAEVLVERLPAAGVEVDDPEWWTVEAADDVGDGPDAEPGPLTLDVLVTHH